MDETEKFASNILMETELYKDITIGGEKIYTGDWKEITPFHIIERVEDHAKDIIVQRNEYKRCCHPELQIPELKKEMIKTLGPIEELERIKKITQQAIRQ